MQPAALSNRARSILTFTLLLLPVCGGTSLSGQTTGVWEPVWTTTSTWAHDSPLFVDDLGEGRYALASEWGIYLTDDAGVTWRTAHRYSIEDAQKSEVFFLTKITGMALAAPDHIVVTIDSSRLGKEVSTVIVTTDGGATWSSFRPVGDYRFTALSMFDDRFGLATARDRGDNSETLFTTINGGFTWTPVPYPAGAAWARDVHAISDREWGMRAYDTTAGGDYFFRTDNGGETWSRSSSPMPPVRKLRFTTSDVVWGAGGAGTGIGHTQRDIVVRSTDGGMTWTTVLDTLLDSPFGLLDIDFLDAEKGIAVGSSGKILRTTDGGDTWVQEWPPSRLIREYVTLRGIAYGGPDEAIVPGSYQTSLVWRGELTLRAPKITAPAHNLADHPITTTLSWTPIEGATYYDVQVGDTVYEHNVVAHQVFDEPYIEETGLTDTSLVLELEPHVRYAIRVRARGGDMTSDWSIVVDLLTKGEGVNLASPYFISPEQGTTGLPLTVDLVWSAVPGATAYDLTIGTEPMFIMNPQHYPDLTATSFRVTGLKPNTTYYARVRARNADGVTSLWSSTAEGALIFITDDISTVRGRDDVVFRATLMPNVATDGTTLSVTTTGGTTFPLRLIDMNGTELVRRSITHLASGQRQYELETSELPSGRYLVVLEHDGEVLQIPLIVVR